MDHDTERPEWVRLPGYDEDAGYQRGYQAGMAGARAGGLRRARRASNWTAAALLAGVAATAGYFAHHTQPAVPTATVVSPGAPGSAVSPGKPTLHAPVATSSGSAVVVTTGPNGVKQYRYRGDD